MFLSDKRIVLSKSRVLYFNIFIVVYVDLMQLHGTYSILLASENKLRSLFNCGNDSLTSIIREIS
ncbi:hypothetical protein T4D_5283 [Trichinella pseudospiralis]|uniref:Uncharacterized protein n=1 Tax=Trichinella pseudospiralis TaxID=6337 RepID=A0A0V1FX82_TRIPS|nr:hypothetical protein T4D_5283 [Trichinella pseudospiralis]